MYCGVCNGSYTVIGEERVGCTTHREQGACSIGKTISARKLEDRVLNGLRDSLITPDLLADFVREFHRVLKRHEREDAHRREVAQDLLMDIDAKIARAVGAIEQGAEVAALRARLVELEAQRRALVAELESAPHGAKLVRINPDAAEIYRQKVSHLREGLSADVDSRMQAISILPSPDR